MRSNMVSSPYQTGTGSSLNQSTRVCIKNIPLSFDENQLREHLLVCGIPITITDCKVKLTHDGRSRRLAYVGFKTAEMASHVVKYFHNTYALTSKLTVEMAFTKSSAPSVEKYRPWSRHSVGSSRHNKKTDNESNQSATVRDSDGSLVTITDGKSLRQECSSKKDIAKESIGTKDASSKSKQVTFQSIGKSKFWSDDNNIEHTFVGDSKPGSNHSPDTTTATENLKQESQISHINAIGSCSSQISFNQIEEAVSDMDFLRSKVINNFDDNDGDDNDSTKGESAATQNSPNIADTGNYNIIETCGVTSDDKDSALGNENNNISSGLGDVSSTRLFIRNLPFGTTENELRDAFSMHGTLSECYIPLDDTNRNFGFGFVEYLAAENASKALSCMNGTVFQGRLLHILPARMRPSSGENDEIVTGHQQVKYKDKIEKARQLNASKDVTGWSASFIRGDTVVDTVANRLGIEKGQLLAVKDGLSGGDAAIRLALAETQILEENREFCKNHGVNIDVISLNKEKSKGKQIDTDEMESVERSLTVIVVKNLPQGTSLEDLSKMFHRPSDCSPKQISISPSKTLALVEYAHPKDAQKAFRTFSYKRFKNVPLYLEWAPVLEGSLHSSPHENNNAFIKTTSQIQTKYTEEDYTSLNNRASNTLFIKNLSFATTENELRDYFEQLVGQVRAVRIPIKVLPTKNSNNITSAVKSSSQHLSMGYGFVEFKTSEASLAALKNPQDYMLNGHLLEVRASSRNDSSSQQKIPSIDDNMKQTKLIVRNVPFEASRVELLQLFGSFGQLKRLRLPKKFDGGHRGFAFVEFMTCEEARCAMKALISTHFYGRHLVVEWAEADSGVDQLRLKAKRDASTATRDNPNFLSSNKKHRL